VEVAEAQSGVIKFEAGLAELKVKVGALRTRVNETSGWWEGDTGTTFRDSFGRACDFFENTLTKKLESHGQRMLKSVQMQHEQDADMASRIKRH